MSKINGTIDLLEAGIKAESLRQRTISNNIANIETPGYKTIDVKFEEVLAKAVDSPEGIEQEDIEPGIYKPENTPTKDNGNDVSFEVEVGKMVKNSLKHSAYVKLLNKTYQQMQLAIDIK
jgi:flagellar basal-body rod protein FlgB